MNIEITWWMWAVLSAALVIAEMSVPGFFIIFFAAGALASSGMAYFWPQSPLWAQVLNFSAVSILALLAFRKPLMKRFGLEGKTLAQEEIVSEIAIPMNEIAPGATGKAELRGTSWSAHNAGDTALAKGQRCKVDKVDGLTIWLKAD